MDLLDRLLGHDVWTTNQILDICNGLQENELDREFDIGHRTIRRTLDHVIHNIEVWSSQMSGLNWERPSDCSVAGMRSRLSVAHERLSNISRRIAESQGWDELWLDTWENPPVEKSFGTAIAHIITHSMHHRAQLLLMLRLSGVGDLPEGDVFSWEERSGERRR